MALQVALPMHIARLPPNAPSMSQTKDRSQRCLLSRWRRSTLTRLARKLRGQVVPQIELACELNRERESCPAADEGQCADAIEDRRDCIMNTPNATMREVRSARTIAPDRHRPTTTSSPQCALSGQHLDHGRTLGLVGHGRARLPPPNQRRWSEVLTTASRYSYLCSSASAAPTCTER